MMKFDTVICKNCGMKKHSVPIVFSAGYNIMLFHIEKTAKCCETPSYVWVM